MQEEAHALKTEMAGAMLEMLWRGVVIEIESTLKVVVFKAQPAHPPSQLVTRGNPSESG